MPGVQSASYPVFFKGILMRDNRDFTTGRILSPLIRFMIPVFFAMLLQAMYGAVDLIIVEQFGHSSDVSAVSTGSQMMMTITNLVTSFAMGTTILLGQRIGEGRGTRTDNGSQFYSPKENIAFGIWQYPPGFLPRYF